MNVIGTASPSHDEGVVQPDHYSDLDAVAAAAFALFSRGVSDRRHAIHTPMFVTNGADGFPAARTLVLRGFDPEQRTLIVHTDRRSNKVAELSADPRVAVAFYDTKSKIQVRASGIATVNTSDAVSEAAYERLSE